MSIYDKINDFLRLKSLSNNETTITSYRSILKKLANYLETHNKKLEEITVEDIVDFLHTISRNSRRQYYTVIKQFLTYIGRGDIVLKLPKIRDIPRNPRALPIEKVLGGIAQLVKAYVCNCDPTLSSKLGVDMDKCIEAHMTYKECSRLARDIVIVWLSLALALRRGELLRIRVGDIDTDKCIARIHRLKTRSNPEIQEMEIPGNLCLFIKHYIQRYGKNKNDKLVDISPYMVEIIIHRFGEMIDHPEMTHHMLRHTILTHLAKAGLGLLELMKYAHHVNPSNTMKYINITMKDIIPRIRDKIREIGEIKAK